MQTIPAIETRYKGFHFRSRLEARWALFFDVLGIKWEYEPEKFGTDAGRYIPDFRLTAVSHRDVYLEVKGPEPSEVDISKCAAVTHAFIAVGNVNERIFYPSTDPFCCDQTREMAFVQCILCGRIDLDCAIHKSHPSDVECVQVDKLAETLDIDDCFLDFTPGDDRSCRAMSAETPLIRLATEAARSARFEDPFFEKYADAYVHIGALLAKMHAFGTTEQYERFNSFALKLSRDPRCPRFERRRTA